MNKPILKFFYNTIIVIFVLFFISACDNNKASGNVEIPDVFVESKENNEFKYDVYTKHIIITEFFSTNGVAKIPESIDGKAITEIGKNAFQLCEFTDINIPNTIKIIGERAFYTCDKLTQLIIPDGVEFIGVRAFGSCYLIESVIIPTSVETIETGAFYNCTNLSAITIPNNVTTIGNKALSGCNANLIIYGSSGSAAEQYANEAGITFQAI